MSGDIRIADMPDIGAVTDDSSVVGEHAGSGRFSAPALRDYIVGNGVALQQLSGNLLINGGCTLDQVNEGAAIAVPNDGGQTTTGPDCWAASGFTAATGMTLQRVGDAPAGALNSIQLTIGTGAAISRTNDGLILFQNLNASQISVLGYGSGGSQPATVSFWMKTHGVSGTFCFALQNASAGRGYVTNFSVSTADVWTLVTLTIPPDDYGNGAAQFSVPTSAATASGNILNFASTSGILVGSIVTGTNIVAEPQTYVNAVNPTSIAISQNVTGGGVTDGQSVTVQAPWTKDPANNIQATFTITVAAGTGWQGAAGQWQTTTPIGVGNGGSAPISTSGQTAQLVTVSGAYVRVGNLSMLAGVRVGYIQEDPATAVMRAQQFRQKSYSQGVACAAAAAGGSVTWSQQTSSTFTPAIPVYFSSVMLLAPSSITLYSATTGAAGMVRDTTSATDKAASATAISSTGFVVTTNAPLAQSPGGMVQFQWLAQASH